MDDCTVTHIGDRRGATWGSCPPPWNLKMMTSYAVLVENTLKFLLAPSACASNSLKFSLHRRKIAKFFVRALGALKNSSFLSVRAVLPPSGRNPAGAHGQIMMVRREARLDYCLTDCTREKDKKDCFLSKNCMNYYTGMRTCDMYTKKIEHDINITHVILKSTLV